MKIDMYKISGEYIHASVNAYWQHRFAQARQQIYREIDISYMRSRLKLQIKYNSIMGYRQPTTITHNT